MQEKIFKRRVYVTAILVFGIALFFLYRLAILHFNSRVNIPADNIRNSIHRGYIYDARGRILAISLEAFSLYVNPTEIENPDETARIVSPIVGIPVAVLGKLFDRNKKFIWIKRKLSDDEFQQISNLKIKGLYFKKEFRRYYPYGDSLSNVLGFVDTDGKGIEGLEFKFNSELNNVGNQDSLVYGNSINLTIDAYVQSVAEKALEAGVKRAGAAQGAVLLMETKTGKILAMAKYPRGNSNSYNDFDAETRRNSFVVDAFEPGSTMKVLSAAALLEKEPGISQKFFLCNGSVQIADQKIKCTDRHGDLQLGGVIQKSCNVGMILAMRNIEAAEYYQFLRRMGFGEKTNVQVAGEAQGFLRNINEWSGLSKYSMSIGQEISVNSVQLIGAVNSIANLGVYQYPQLISNITSDDGRVVRRFPDKTKGRVMREETSRFILQAMRNCVINGTGVNAALAEYEIAGKTGTAQKSKDTGGYYQDRYVASFIGIVPYNNPEYTIFVIIDDPRIITSGGGAAAPISAAIGKIIYPYLGLQVREVSVKVPKQYADRKIVAPDVMPDWRGRNLSEVLGELISLQRDRKVNYRVYGNGKILEAQPAAGTKLQSGMEIILHLED